MADINKLFSTFNNKITLSKSKSDSLKQGRDALRTKIKNWFSDQKKNQPTFCWQGSFAMKTTVNPLSGEYDLDDGIYLSGYSDQKISDWPSPSTVHSWIKSAVNGHTLQPPVDKDTCIRVVYASGYHIDYPIYIMKDDIAYLAHKTKGWTESDPKAFKDWFIQHINDQGEQLRSLVKYLKAWKDFKEIPLKGIEITILTTNNFEAYEGRDEKSLKLTIENIIDTLEESFSCVKPVNPKEDLFDGISQTRKDSIQNGFENLKNKLISAIDEPDEEAASQYMIDVFGDRFPKGEPTKDNSKSTSSYVKTSAPGVFQHDGRSA